MTFRPNILYIMSDDHASHAMSCYGGRLNRTPHMDRIAAGGMRLDNCFCTNSICAPSRATILTGTYNHVNGVTTLRCVLDNRKMNFARLLQAAGYQTAVVGKWHLGIPRANWPADFDYWCVLPGQGRYHDPAMNEMGREKVFPGYVTDVITDLSLDWLKRRDRSRPFCLLCHHKAPHSPRESDDKHARMYEDVEIPPPATFDDDYSHRAAAARETRMRIDRDLDITECKQPMPPGLSPAQQKHWKYQRFIKDYLRCVASIDDNVGRMLDYLEAEGLEEDTLVVYTSDQGLFLGDHGWFDKRFMYEESLRMPLVVRYGREVRPESTCGDMVLNVDFAQTLLDYADVQASPDMQGASFRPLLAGRRPAGWRTSMYYRYWMHLDREHHVYAHYGVRTLRHKLIYYYADGLGQPGTADDPKPPEWELFDLEKDPRELFSVYDDPAYAGVVKELKAELRRLQAKVGDTPYEKS